VSEVAYACESLREVREAHLEALLLRHWREIAHYDDIPLDVDWAVYESAEATGKLCLYTARLDGELIGYAAFLVQRAPHYAGSIQAVQDVLFVAPEHRRGRVGIGLIRFSEEQLATQGVQLLYQHQKLAHPALGRILASLGYEPVEQNWAKRLDRR